MAASPKDEVTKRDADGAHKKRGRQNQPVQIAAKPLTVTPTGTLGQQEKSERREFQKRVHRKKNHDAREQE
jgi:hypothetical protein